jgi:hypothetical protein
MLYKYVSAKVIIQQIMSRFGVIDGNLTYDALDWIGRGIGLIGTHANYVNVITPLEVDFHKIPYPDNFYQLNFIVYNGRKLRYGVKPTYFDPHSSGYGTTDDPLVLDLIQSVFAKRELVEVIDNAECCDEKTLDDLNSKQQLLDTRIASLIDFVGTNQCYHGDEWFTNNPGGDCFDTSLECGTVYMSYKAYPVDKEGFPLIIDEAKYLEALEWYVMRCLIENGYKHPTLDYNSVDVKTRIALSRATNEHLKMSYEEYDNFIANWTNMTFQLRPNNDYYSNG